MQERLRRQRGEQAFVRELRLLSGGDVERGATEVSRRARLVEERRPASLEPAALPRGVGGVLDVVTMAAVRVERRRDGGLEPRAIVGIDGREGRVEPHRAIGGETVELAELRVGGDVLARHVELPHPGAGCLDDPTQSLLAPAQRLGLVGAIGHGAVAVLRCLDSAILRPTYHEGALIARSY